MNCSNDIFILFLCKCYRLLIHSIITLKLRIFPINKGNFVFSSNNAEIEKPSPLSQHIFHNWVCRKGWFFLPYLYSREIHYPAIS